VIRRLLIKANLEELIGYNVTKGCDEVITGRRGFAAGGSGTRHIGWHKSSRDNNIILSNMLPRCAMKNMSYMCSFLRMSEEIKTGEVFCFNNKTLCSHTMDFLTCSFAHLFLANFVGKLVILVYSLGIVVCAENRLKCLFFSSDDGGSPRP